jgi:carbonic anhydrase
MSIYRSSSSWNCPGVNQSPINLSQANAEPCDLLCELTMDEVNVSEANLMISNEGLIVTSTSGLGTCKYNGEGYTCNAILINHPSHHTIETIQADGEVMAIFTNPNKPYLCISSLFRVNSTQSPSTKFFNAIIPYANNSNPITKLNLGNDWSLNMMVPSTGSYFSYNGSVIVPPCQQAQYVVFKSMINIDPNDFALLVKNVQAGSRPIQGLGNRQVFFNNVEKLPGAPQAHDNRLYIRLRKLGGKNDAPNKSAAVTSAPIKNSVPNETTKSIMKSITTEIQNNGVMAYVDLIILIASVVIGAYFGSKTEYRFIGSIISKRAQPLAVFILSIFGWVYNLMSVAYRFAVSFFTRPKTTPVEQD